MVHLLVLNPNSSSSITRSLEALLGRSPTPGVRLSFLTGPEGEAPQAIDDEASAERSAKACKRMLDEEERELAGQVDGVLVCCFSDHPLVPLLQEFFGPTGPRVLGMFEAALSAALLLAQASPTGRFAILTTVESMCPGIDDGVNRFLGVSSAESDGGRYGGSFASSLGVLDLHPPSTESIAADEGERKAIVDRKMRTTAARCRTEGKASVVLLGCAGMSGFEDVVRRGWAEAGGGQDEREAGAVVVDGVKAGVELLAALCRLTATAKAGWA